VCGTPEIALLGAVSPDANLITALTAGGPASFSRSMMSLPQKKRIILLTSCQDLSLGGGNHDVGQNGSLAQIKHGVPNADNTDEMHEGKKSDFPLLGTSRLGVAFQKSSSLGSAYGYL
jgi:hypothetical protein